MPREQMNARSSASLESVLELARVTGDAAMRYFRQPLNVETKADGSPVTMADRSAETEARAWIARHFPDDAVVGEEQGGTRGGAKRYWLIDPIDGTKAFVHGVPLWSTLIALVEDGRVIAGAAHFPAVAEIVGAALGCGAFRNGAPCRVSAVSDLSRATVLTTDTRLALGTRRLRAFEELARAAAVARTWGDGYGYLMVATGRAEIMVDEVVNEWDIAPWRVIVAEAGGVVKDWEVGALATNAALAEEVQQRLVT